MLPKDRHLTRENVIRDTHYGTTVYTHILRSFYPDETLMYVKGDECGWVKNPWDNSRQSLHIWMEKIPNGTRLPDRIGRHHELLRAHPRRHVPGLRRDVLQEIR